MAVEIPALSAIIARLPDARVNLAAYGGIIFPLALIIEAPIIMLLAASVALSKDWAAFLKIRRFMMVTSAILTGLHILVAFTPLYDLVAGQVMRVPPEIIEPGRLGLQLMTPWTWAIAYRQTHSSKRGYPQGNLEETNEQKNQSGNTCSFRKTGRPTKTGRQTPSLNGHTDGSHLRHYLWCG